MAPSKENNVLTAPPDSIAAVPTQPFRPDETSARPNPVALEVPVTVNGARTVEGSDKREPFSETTKTVLVFGNGAVIRLGSPVAAGQLLFLTNEKTKKEVVCQVVKSKNYRSVSGYVELEFTEPVVGFWGMRFPTDRIAPPTATQVPSAPASTKVSPVAPAPPAPRVTSPVVNVAPKIPEVAPPIRVAAQPAAPRIETKVTTLAPAKPQAVPVPGVAAPVTPVQKDCEAPVVLSRVNQVPPVANTLADSVASILSPQEQRPTLLENRQSPAGLSETEALKQQAAKLQEQLSAMLFSAAPTIAAPAPPAPSTSAAPTATPVDSRAAELTAKVAEITKPELSPVKTVVPARPVPPPVKSSLDAEEVKIPSWLEPLARNAAAPTSTQELIEREKAKHAAEMETAEEHVVEAEPLAIGESVPAAEPVPFGNPLSLDEETSVEEPASTGSNRGVLIGAIAAGVLVLAGGGWFFLRPTSSARSANAPITTVPASVTSEPTTQASNVASVAANPPAVQPATQPESPSSIQKPATTEPVSVPSVNQAAASLTPTKTPANIQPKSNARENTRAANTPVPAAEKERISRTAAAAPPETVEPQPKKPALGEIHLASPTVNRRSTAQNVGDQAPTLGATDAPNPGSLDGGLVAAGSGPAAPEAPRPVGGDVKPARLLSKVDPSYPAIAKNQHITGDVLVDALIDANGRVTTMKVISGPTLLHQAAMDALRQWKYQPATLDGTAVPMHLTVKLQFRMQ